MRAITCAILAQHFQLSVELPLDRLLPRVPVRLNYIKWIDSLLRETAAYGSDQPAHGIDIGASVCLSW